MSVAQIERNPFIIAPGEYWADRETLWNKIIEYIELARHTRNNEIIVLTGDYGCGTTHSLKCIKKYLTEKGATASYVTMPVQGEFGDLYSAFIKDLGEEKRKIIIARIMENLGIIALPTGFDIKDVEIALENFVSSPSRYSMAYRSHDILREAGILRRLPSLTELWASMILALSTKEWPLFILIDEVDVAVANETLQRIRQLYDDSLYGLCLMFGLKGEPKDVETILGRALYTRMSLQPIQLYPISKEEGKEFLRTILKKRTPSKRNAFFPFTEKSIDTLIDTICPTTPRRLLRICSLIFEQARIENQEIIDEQFVSKIVVRFGEISLPLEMSRGETGTLEEESRRAGIPQKPLLQGLVEFGADGIPHITTPTGKWSAKEVIALLLYSRSPSTIGLRELARFVSMNWKSVNTRAVSANLSQMHQLVIPEGKKGSYSYRLSGAGISWVENVLVPKNLLKTNLS